VIKDTTTRALESLHDPTPPRSAVPPAGQPVRAIVPAARRRCSGHSTERSSVRKIVFLAVITVALSAAVVAFAATTIINPADKIQLAYAKKALVAKAGKVTLKMPNPSRVFEHNIALRKGTGTSGKTIKKGKVVEKGGTSTITVTLAKGKYRFFCTVAGHEKGGMWGILTVK
jgi:uncharacterized cupredoxin-like copper-binding protein